MEERKEGRKCPRNSKRVMQYPSDYRQGWGNGNRTYGHKYPDFAMVLLPSLPRLYQPHHISCEADMQCQVWYMV